ncbi:lipid-binding SYLF domain-containing protein [Proteobacteria bacterium 005FR1]|nr:lipid-binding SYLF domain-containing protein [Proteobacteria bacterium 005FR1]
MSTPFSVRSHAGLRLLVATAFLLSLGCAATAQEQDEQEPTPFEHRDEDVDQVIDRPPENDEEAAVADNDAVETDTTRDDVAEAVVVLSNMQEDADLRQLLEEAQGVFVVPEYATAALIIGAGGGEGVLFTRKESGWGNPGLYDVGSLSAGLQVGVAAGSIAMILLTPESLEVFMSDTNFALTAEAGFSIVDWSARARTQIDEGSDVVLWTDTEGFFAELSVGFSNITWDEEENEDFYGETVTARAVIADQVANPHREVLQALQQ